MNDREMLCLAFGALKTVQDSGEVSDEVVSIVQEHLFPPVQTNFVVGPKASPLKQTIYTEEAMPRAEREILEAREERSER